MGRLVEIRGNARLEESTTLGRTHLFEFSGGHDILCHLSVLHLAPMLEPDEHTVDICDELPGAERQTHEHRQPERERNVRER